MRQVATAISLCIALLSGVVLAQVWVQTPTRSTSVRAEPAGQVESTTLTFYQAVNTYFDGGDDTALRRILHPEFVTHHPGRTATGTAADFLRQLDSIRDLFPGIRLAPEVASLGNNTASASLSLSNPQVGAFAGIQIDPVDVVGRLDFVRIEHKLVVEHWSSVPLAAELEAFPALSIELPVALDRVIARVQPLSLDGAPGPAINPFGHLVLIVQSGEVSVEVIEPAAIPATIWRVDHGPAPIEPGIIATLGQMEVVFLPAKTAFRIWDSNYEDATLIVLEFGPPVSGELPPTPPLLDALAETSWSGIVLKGIGDRLTLSFGRAILPPQATLPSPRIEGMELTWVGGGSIEMAVSSGTARVRDASGVRSQPNEGAALLQPGNAGAAGPESEISYRNAGAIPATVWFFSLVSASEQSNQGETGAPAPFPTPSRQNLS